MNPLFETQFDDKPECASCMKMWGRRGGTWTSPRKLGSRTIWRAVAACTLRILLLPRFSTLQPYSCAAASHTVTAVDAGLMSGRSDHCTLPGTVQRRLYKPVGSHPPTGMYQLDSNVSGQAQNLHLHINLPAERHLPTHADEDCACFLPLLPCLRQGSQALTEPSLVRLPRPHKRWEALF